MPECDLFQKVQESMNKIASTQCCNAISTVMAGAPPVGVKKSQGQSLKVLRQCAICLIPPVMQLDVQLAHCQTGSS